MTAQKNYTVWCPELAQQAEDGKSFGGSAKDAAAAWAEWIDASRCEYSIVRGAVRIVRVRDEVTGRVSDFVVTGRSMPIYTASPA